MLETKTAIVTGASRGIGHATAQRFRDLGWRVITVSRTPPPDACPWSQGGNTHISLDLSDLQQILKTVEALRPLLGGAKLHALINNAGISPKGPGGTRVNSLTTDLDVWQSMYNTNFYAPLVLTRGFAQELSNAGGSVVNLCSIAGSRVHPFAGSAYATSKSALAALTREMANDMAPLNVRVNAIAPGEIDTDILSPGTSQIVENDIPMRRLGTVEEVADLIEFLCSEKASYITGTEIPIDGGQRI
ncbi:SDR family NAD(P)-dependent oxidoreductase [Variovorax paradoxus]|uniref:Short-chain dehydrogenase/reductase SDR n=1 Tax=Variovorax paradoxus (strain EPS) TaxID=595537 RepID=E6UVR2_VARPE|nr:SDR family oxidoreductase [Variovorax paradoxus]ADU35295.1 short-chain dehydrogenase/reductase SDR [Variovorax paradoxus EPS]